MMARPLLIRVLREPGLMARLGLAEWDLLLRQALAANLTASLYCLAEEHELLAGVPAQPRRHLAWARALLARHGEGVRWEVDRIGAALASLDRSLELEPHGEAAARIRGLVEELRNRLN